MFVTKRELARLERELAHAVRRADGAEKALADERQRHDWLILQLTNRVVTKHGGYGLEETKPVNEPPKSPQKGYTHEPTVEDLDKLEYYKLCYRNAGMDEELAQTRWEAEMRGEFMPIEMDRVETEQ